MEEVMSENKDVIKYQWKKGENFGFYTFQMKISNFCPKNSPKFRVNSANANS